MSRNTYYGATISHRRPSMQLRRKDANAERQKCATGSSERRSGEEWKGEEKGEMADSLCMVKKPSSDTAAPLFILELLYPAGARREARGARRGGLWLQDNTPGVMEPVVWGPTWRWEEAVTGLLPSACRRPLFFSVEKRQHNQKQMVAESNGIDSLAQS